VDLFGNIFLCSHIVKGIVISFSGQNGVHNQANHTPAIVFHQALPMARAM
jgi:hypothetical protein